MHSHNIHTGNTILILLIRIASELNKQVYQLVKRDRGWGIWVSHTRNGFSFDIYLGVEKNIINGRLSKRIQNMYAVGRTINKRTHGSNAVLKPSIG